MQTLLLPLGSLFSPFPSLSAQQDRTGTAPSSATVLVVDDHEQSRALAARMLREEGYRVLEAQSGEEALKLLAEVQEVQVILTDISMPGGIDGVELARRITEQDPGRPVVLMSGYARIFPQLQTSAQPFPLLLKPFSAAQLARQIRDVLKRDLH